ncbi:MAG TPA: VOC family protein [Kofleriaceae bacterium]|nr:VOC family protein [Kofleriaceae bacterium]
MVNDIAKAKQFYARVFGWRFDDTRFPGYTIIDTGGEPAGGMMARPPSSPAAALNNYFEVDDAGETLRKVVEAGGTVIVPKTEIPRVGWFAMFLDPDQIPIGILQPTKAGVP